MSALDVVLIFLFATFLLALGAVWLIKPEYLKIGIKFLLVQFRPARALPWPLRLRAATANLTANERHLWTLPYITVESPCDGHSSHDRRGRGAAGGAPEHGKEPRGARLPAGGEAGEVRPVPFR